MENEAGIIEIDFVENPDPEKYKQVKLLGIYDIRVAKAILPSLDVPKFIEIKYKKCPVCFASVIRDWDKNEPASRCLECQFDLLSAVDKDSWETWKRENQAKITRRRIRNELYEETQLEFGDFLADQNSEP